MPDKSDPAPLKSSKGQKVPFAEIIEHLNHQAGKNFRPDTKSSQNHIRARFAEGFTQPDFIKVIDRKVSQWKADPKMADFLRPETLFGPKFEAYLNESNKTVVTSEAPQRRYLGIDIDRKTLYADSGQGGNRR